MKKFEGRKVWTCLRCNHEWTGRGSDPPRACGKCKSGLWNVPRQAIPHNSYRKDVTA